MDMLRRELPGVAVTTIDELGIPADAKEAYFFALIGFLTVHQLPGNLAVGDRGAGTRPSSAASCPAAPVSRPCEPRSVAADPARDRRRSTAR